MPITFWAKRFGRNVLGESFDRKFFFEPYFEFAARTALGARFRLGRVQRFVWVGWAGLGWAGLGCWAAGQVGQAWTGLTLRGWAGLAAGLGWAGAGLGGGGAGVGCGWGWAGLGCWAAGMLGCWAAGLLGCWAAV